MSALHHLRWCLCWWSPVMLRWPVTCMCWFSAIVGYRPFIGLGWQVSKDSYVFTASFSFMRVFLNTQHLLEVTKETALPHCSVRRQHIFTTADLPSLTAILLCSNLPLIQPYPIKPCILAVYLSIYLSVCLSQGISKWGPWTPREPQRGENK